MLTTASGQGAKELNVLINAAYRGQESKRGWTTEAEILGGIRMDENDFESDVNSGSRKDDQIYQERWRDVGHGLFRTEGTRTIPGHACSFSAFAKQGDSLLQYLASSKQALGRRRLAGGWVGVCRRLAGGKVP